MVSQFIVRVPEVCVEDGEVDHIAILHTSTMIGWALAPVATSYSTLKNDHPPYEPGLHLSVSTVTLPGKRKKSAYTYSVPNRWDAVCSTRARRHVIVSAPLLQRASAHMQGLKGHVNVLEKRSSITKRQLSLALSWDSSYCCNKLP